MPKKVLVTGAGGFIGSHLTEALVKCGYEVRCLVSYNSRNDWGWLEHIEKQYKDGLEVIAGDVRDQNFCDVLVNGVERIYHLAALIAIPFSYIAPASYIDTNVVGTHNILQSALRHDVEKVVCTSTSETYGSAQYVPISEAHPLNAQSPYAASKIASDQLALSFYHSFSQNLTILRPFNTFGPRQSARAIIPTIISQIALGQRELKLGNISPTRDFTYVTDTAQGFISAMDSRHSSGKIVNIGSNFEISIEELVKLIASLMQVEVSIITDKQRKRPSGSEVDRLCADTTLAKKLLNWNPRFSGPDGFQLGMKNTIRWFEDSENLALYKSNTYNI
jgi:NAD dependent epimerase/dehydratase